MTLDYILGTMEDQIIDLNRKVKKAYKYCCILGIASIVNSVTIVLLSKDLYSKKEAQVDKKKEEEQE